MAAVRQRELMHHAERFNSLTHLAGAVLAVVGVTLLVVSASREGDPWKIVSFAVYGTTLSLLFIFSTLYHSLRGRAKSVFRRLDHLAIYLLIAGSYTPFALVTLYGAWGWSLFGVVWGLARARCAQAAACDVALDGVRLARRRRAVLHRRHRVL